MADQINENIFLKFIEDGELRTVNKAMEKALRYSSGKYSSKKLARMGHPYAVRNAGVVNEKGRLAVPYGDPAFINIQTGEFFLSWRRRMPKLSNDVMTSQLTNIAPYADKLAKGIPDRTIARPLIERIMPVVQYWREKNLAVAIRDAIQAMR